MERLQDLLLMSDSGENFRLTLSSNPFEPVKVRLGAPPLKEKLDNFRKSKDIAPTSRVPSVLRWLGYSCGEHAPLKWSS
ncbi:hypothetical protein AbraIFM66951_009478, partial [Aspergillus brasiliensis]